MSNFLKRTWVEVNLDNLEYNYNYIRSRLNDKTKYMAVVKADAYGHGAKVVPNFLQTLGADFFAVSNIDEALQLREFGINKPILILGYTPTELVKVLADNDISQAVIDKNYASSLANSAQKENVKIKVHIKIDTGMSRLGFFYHNPSDTNSITDIVDVLDTNYLIREGIFTHFATSDLDNDENGEHTKKQFELFVDCIKKLEEKGVDFELRHCANSAATLNNPEYQLDMVRPGIIMYGLNPSKHFEKFDLKPAFKLKSIISMIKTIQKGTTVSYGKTFVANKDMKVATIPVGYADGYPRSLSNKGYVMINGKKAAILGRVCMDQMIVDISDIDDVKVGQNVLLFGDKDLTVDDFSVLCQTINYETVCVIGKRVPRVYFKDGKEIQVVDLIHS